MTEQAQAQKGLPKTVAKVTKAQVKALDALPNTSAKIRYLAAEGFSTPENKYSGIANFLSTHMNKNVRTQQVRNVLTQPLKKK